MTPGFPDSRIPGSSDSQTSNLLIFGFPDLGFPDSQTSDFQTLGFPDFRPPQLTHDFHDKHMLKALLHSNGFFALRYPVALMYAFAG